MSESTPLSLLDRLRRQPDDGEGWRRLLDLYSGWLEGWVRRLAHLSPEDPDAAEVVQNSFGIVARELPRFEHNGRTGAFRAWLKQILVNCLRDWQRQRRRVAGESDVLLDQLADPASDLSRQWDQEHQAHVIDQLFERGRRHFTAYAWQVFERTVLDEVPAPQAAADLGVTVNAVLLAKSRVLAWLRREGGELLD
jgi:RNA polymerase sigma-70 factor, ECF subfamily